jgi:hypothetical protein
MEKAICSNVRGGGNCEIADRSEFIILQMHLWTMTNMKNIPSHGFRHQSAKLWNSKTSVDVRNAKLTTLQLRTFPK